MTTTSVTSSGRTPSLLELAITFNHIALASFGGGLSAWSREIVVVRKSWMHDEEFLSAVTMCRILPGANQVNLAVFVGTKFHGVSGAVAAVCGLCALPVAIAMGLAYAYFRFHQVPEVDSILRGATSAAIALTLAMAIKTGKKCLGSIFPIVFCAAIFLLNGVLRWPLLASLALTAPPALLWAWQKIKR
jgi:chromate transporter